MKSERIRLLATTAILAACASASSESFHGEWRVVALAPAGISALTPEEASAWVGTVARYYPDTASFGADSCSRPTYSQRTVDRASFYEQFRSHPRDLHLSEGEVTLVDIDCDGERIAPGGTLVLESHDRLLAAWDGIFFELARR